MSRVASNYAPVRYSNGPPSTIISRSGSNASSVNGNEVHSTNNSTSIVRPIIVRSAAPMSTQKETVHICPLCNAEYKDPRVLPCTHTFCFNCIRQKLINNAVLTCPKCEHQVEPFDESHLKELQRNLILSQEWRMAARLPPSSANTKKSTPYQPTVQSSTDMHRPIEKRSSVTSEPSEPIVLPNGSNSPSVATLINHFRGAANNTAPELPRSTRSSRSSSVVSNQVSIVESGRNNFEAQGNKQKSRSSSVASTVKNEGSFRSIEQRENPSILMDTPVLRATTRTHETPYEEIHLDGKNDQSVPAAPPLPELFQARSVRHEGAPEPFARPPSVHSRDDNHSIHERSLIMASPLAHRSVDDGQIPSRPSTAASRSYRPSDDGDDADDEENPARLTPVPQIVYAQVSQRGHHRQGSHTDSINSAASASISRHSPILQTLDNHQQQTDLDARRSPSVSSSIRRSSDRFPPPPPSIQNVETLDLPVDNLSKRRTLSAASNESSLYAVIQDTNKREQVDPLLTQRFSSQVENATLSHLVPSPNVNSQRGGSGTSTPMNRPASRQDQTYLAPIMPNTLNPNLNSRVDSLLSDQRRLERDIEEQMKRLKHDYEDIRTQINRKEASIHNEVKNIANRLDDDITKHYHRKQKIFISLAANADNARSELENLRSITHLTDNKQRIWADLEVIEANLRDIRREVEQQTDLGSSLSFAEGHRSLGAETIGQITYNSPSSNQARRSSPPSRPPRPEQLSTNISPYKYMKIDHLSTLEPESIAISDDNKKILLGICNKLFILEEHGETLRTIQMAPSIRGITISKRNQNVAYVSHDETVSMIDINTGKTLDSVKETDSSGESGTFLPLGIDTDNVRGDVFVCDYRNSCVIKFDDKLEFITQWRVYNHSKQYDEARPKLVSVYGQRFYMIVEHSCKPYHNQGIAYTFSLHICDTTSGNIIKIIDADLLATERLRWPCSVQAINHDKCYILDTMTSGKYFNGQWQKHWSRVLEINQADTNVVNELFQLDSEAATMAMTKQNMIIAANGDILFVDLGFLKSTSNNENRRQ